MIAAPFQLSEGEKQSPHWASLAKHLEDRLAELRQLNDKADQTEIQTAITRGRIAEIKRLLELRNTRPDFVVPTM